MSKIELQCTGCRVFVETVDILCPECNSNKLRYTGMIPDSDPFALLMKRFDELEAILKAALSDDEESPPSDDEVRH